MKVNEIPMTNPLSRCRFSKIAAISDRRDHVHELVDADQEPEALLRDGDLRVHEGGLRDGDRRETCQVEAESAEDAWPGGGF